MKSRPVAGGGRAVEVSADRLAGWFERFSLRNDGVHTTELGPAQIVVTGGNGATATVRVPFGPLKAEGTHAGLAVDPLVAHMRQPRRIGLVLVRLGAHSVGVAHAGQVVASRTDRHWVHGRNSAGGWSQQRFARRRADQARHALRSAADDVCDVLASELARLDAVVLGGDRRALDELRAEDRLSDIFALAEPAVLDLAEPRRAVLDEAARRACTVEIVVRDRVAER